MVDTAAAAEGGFDPFYMACQNGHMQIVQLLVRLGLNYAVDTPNTFGKTTSISRDSHSGVIRPPQLSAQTHRGDCLPLGLPFLVSPLPLLDLPPPLHCLPLTVHCLFSPAALLRLPPSRSAAD